MPHKEYIANRVDLMTAIVRITYEVSERAGKLYLAKFCTVNYAGCIRLFTDIDKEVKSIEVFSGDVLDGIYRRKQDGGDFDFEVIGFPFK